MEIAPFAWAGLGHFRVPLLLNADIIPQLPMCLPSLLPSALESQPPSWVTAAFLPQVKFIDPVKVFPGAPYLRVIILSICERLVFQSFYFLMLGHCNPGIKIDVISMLQIRLCTCSFVPLSLIIPILVTHFLESWTCFNP